MPTIQKQRDELEDVRLLLQCWGNWLNAVNETQLGHKSQSVFSISPGGTQEYDDDKAEEIEQVLVHLLREVPLAYKVIEQSYYFKGSVRDGCERLKIKRTRYCDLKLQGETFVFAYLAMAKKYKKIA